MRIVVIDDDPLIVMALENHPGRRRRSSNLRFRAQRERKRKSCMSGSGRMFC